MYSIIYRRPFGFINMLSEKLSAQLAVCSVSACLECKLDWGDVGGMAGK